MKILITGFDPFGGENINPAWETVKNLPEIIAGAEVIKLEIPTVFGKAVEKIQNKVEEIKPHMVIAVGQAGGRVGVTPERIAINIDDARIKDNEGNQPIDSIIEKQGENAYFTNLPIKAMVEEMKKQGIPGAVSNTAGTFVCNHVMYGILYMIDKKYTNMRGGFIHVPFIPQQVVNKPNMPSMSASDITKALELCIKVAVENHKDIKKVGGTIC